MTQAGGTDGLSVATEAEVAAFWNAHPCGEAAVGGRRNDYLEFFDRYDGYRYEKEPHILRRLDELEWAGKRVLEIGLGLGADSEQIVRRGGRWSGVDLTEESVDVVRTRFDLHALPHERLEVASVLDLPFDAQTFDVVYSFGVLHHVPQVRDAQREIARVLKPGGRLVAMLYAKHSVNYWISIALVRRAAVAAVCLTGRSASGILGAHVRNARVLGLRRYLAMERFLHANTDGPYNPYSRVYTVRDVRREFDRFRLVKAQKDFMHAPPLPVGRLDPLAGLLGWHLWVHLESLA